MFTGLVEDVGTIAGVSPDGDALRLEIASAFNDLALGESIACDGVCLTVTSQRQGRFEVLAGPETLARTTAGRWVVGQALNLERALLATTRLGGHIGAGHVDGLGTIASRQARGPAVDFAVRTPPELLRYVVAKGSICVDGISLTVNTVDEYAFSVSLIPHTLEHTALGRKRVDDAVNLEVDIIGKYVEKLLGGRTPRP
jgi:riboflavin synthase